MIFFFTCCVIIVRYHTKSKNNNQKLADIELNVARLYLFILSLGLFFSCFSFLIFYRNLYSIFLFHLWNIWGISIQRSAEGKHEREDKKRALKSEKTNKQTKQHTKSFLKILCRPFVRSLFLKPIDFFVFFVFFLFFFQSHAHTEKENWINEIAISSSSTGLISSWATIIICNVLLIPQIDESCTFFIVHLINQETNCVRVLLTVVSSFFFFLIPL